jgi:Tol biopolymer transport system component
VRQVTNELGYDGGAFFSPDGTMLVYRSSRPKTPEEQAEYKELLAQGLVAPTNMEIYVCNVDGSNVRRITSLGKANWAPFFHPSQKKIIFSSNHASPRGYDFQLYMINVDGTGLEKITSESIFNAFPMFSPDGKYIVWSSNRNNQGTRDTNVFVAEWVD